jgi:signal peptidase II
MPLAGAVVLVALDQITKALVVSAIREGTIFARYFGDFIWIVHTRNTGAAFSIGAGSPPVLRFLFFIAFPLAVLVGVFAYYVSCKNCSMWLRWSIGLILGGGMGNLIDRIFRHNGVVDFISVKMYGLFGMERFATFNIADSAITIGEILLMISLIILEFQKPKESRKSLSERNHREERGK